MNTAASLLEVIELLSIQLAAFVALLMWVSGLHKLIRYERARAAVHEFAGVPRSLAPITAAAVGVVELLTGALLWVPSCRAGGAALAALIWGSYILFMVRAIAAGRDVDCGCSFGAAHSPLGVGQVLRNLALTSLAIVIALVSQLGGAGPIGVPAILAGFALLAVYGALDQVMALRPLRTGELL